MRQPIQPWGTHPRERLFTGDQTETGSEFSPSFDAFHLPFPASAEECITVVPRHNIQGREDESAPDQDTGRRKLEHAGQERDNDSTPSLAARRKNKLAGRHQSDDPILKLPNEVSDLILSYLSLATLDAARYTCKAWHRYITSNSWVLSSVLGKRGETDLRELLKSVDGDWDLLSRYQHPDAWRTRFRMRSLNFSIPTEEPSSGASPSKYRYAAAARVGSQGGFMVLQLVPSGRLPSPSERKCILVIYRFSPADVPLFAGCIHHPGVGDMKIISMTKIKPHTKSTLKIDIGGNVNVYKLSPRKAFSSLDSHFCIKDLGSSHRSQTRYSENFIEVAQEIQKSLGIHINSGQSWKILAFLPPNPSLHRVCFYDGLRNHIVARCLADEGHSSNICVLVENYSCKDQQPESGENVVLERDIDAMIKKGHLQGSALLSRPHSDALYRNIAVAPLLTRDGILRVAIIWQSKDGATMRSELYIYDLREENYYGRCAAYNDPPTTSQPYDVVQGKRVRSVGRFMGGVHPSSPLFTEASAQEIALGGLQFPHSKENQDVYSRNVQFQKCFVWGPADSNGDCTSIECSIFDFSFADPQHLCTLARDGMRTRQQMLIHNAHHCACKLHDDGFRVELPDPGTATTIINPPKAQQPKNSSFWPWKTLPPEHKQTDIGSVTHYDPPARQRALEREKEWFRERIRGMRGCRLSDFEIAEQWAFARWTQWGDVRKPDGWTEL